MNALTAGRGGSYSEMSVEPSSKALEISVASPEPGRAGSQRGRVDGALFYRSDARDCTAALNPQESDLVHAISPHAPRVCPHGTARLRPR